MTHKTDIATLLLEMRDLAERIVECQGENSEGEEIIHLYDLSDTTFKAQNILLVLDALEAERQQREGVEAELSDLLNQEFQQRLANAEHQLEMKDLAIRNVKASRMAQFRKRKAAEAELAALRGGQEPVAWIKCGEVTTEPTTADVWIREMNEGYGYDVEVLCKRQPKPVVVLPPRRSAKDYVDDEFTNADLAAIYNAARLELKVRIQNAGIVVKDGE